MREASTEQFTVAVRRRATRCAPSARYERDFTRRTCIVIVELRAGDETLIMGVMADSVHQVVDFTAGQVQPAPAFGPRVHVDCLLGMASSNGKFVLLLDIDRIFSSDEIVAAGSTVVADQIMEHAAVAAE